MPDEGGKLSSNGVYRTDKNGEILISGIVGTQVVTETKTISGYVIDEETRSQTVVINPDDLQTLTFYNRPAGGLQIIKSDEDTGARIKGVKFEVRKINGEILGTYTTDRNGVISISFIVLTSSGQLRPVNARLEFMDTIYGDSYQGVVPFHAYIPKRAR